MARLFWELSRAAHPTSCSYPPRSMGKKSSNRKAAAHGREDKKRDRATKKQLKKERKARKHGKEYDAELLAVRTWDLYRAPLLST